MNIRDLTFTAIGLMGASVVARYAFGLDPLIVSIAQPILAQVPVLGNFCAAVHSAAQATLDFTQAGLVALVGYEFPPGTSDPGIGLALTVMVAMAVLFFVPSLVMSTFSESSGNLALFCAGMNISVSLGYFLLSYFTREPEQST